MNYPKKNANRKRAHGKGLEEGDKWPEKKLPPLISEIMRTYESQGDLEHLEKKNLPSRDVIIEIFNDFMRVLFPSFFGNANLTKSNVQYFLGDTLHSLYIRLREEVEKILHQHKECLEKSTAL